MQPTMENISLKQDNGSDLNFRGRLFSECSWFEENVNELVKQKLYITEENDQIYYVVRSQGEKKTRHCYRYSVDGETCLVKNGSNTVALPFDQLMLAVQGMIGAEDGEIPTIGEIDDVERKIMNS